MKTETADKLIEDYFPSIVDDIKCGNRANATQKLSILLKIVEARTRSVAETICSGSFTHAEAIKAIRNLDI